MTPEIKESILKNINRIPVAELIEFAVSKQIPFEEMQNTGNLDHVKQAEIREVLRKEDEIQQVEDNLWNSCETINSSAKYQEYIKAYPNGKYNAIAKARIDQIKETQQSQKQGIIDDIKRRSYEITNYDLNQLFDSGSITKDDLITNGIIERDKLDLFLNPPSFYMDQIEWKDLAALPNDRTDVYFFGVPRSGKSSVLAGVLKTAHKHGLLRTNSQYPTGARYADELIRCVNVGYVPRPTDSDEDTVNFICTDLKENGEVYPFNFVEMSGEYFNRAYESNDLDGSIGARGYLKNNNRKLIFLFIDYSTEVRGDDMSEIASQDSILNNVLDKLDRDGTLAKTDSLQLIITKADLMDGDHSERKNVTLEYMKNNHRNLLEFTKDLAIKYNWNKAKDGDNKVLMHPFSLGKFMLGKTYNFNPRDSEELIRRMIQTAQNKKKTSIWNKVKKGF